MFVHNRIEAECEELVWEPPCVICVIVYRVNIKEIDTFNVVLKRNY